MPRIDETTDKKKPPRRQKRKGWTAVYPEVRPLLFELLRAHSLTQKEAEDGVALFVALLPVVHSQTGEVRGANRKIAALVCIEIHRFGKQAKMLASVGLLERMGVARNGEHPDRAGWRIPLPVYEWATDGGERTRLMPLFGDLFRGATRRHVGDGHRVGIEHGAVSESDMAETEPAEGAVSESDMARVGIEHGTCRNRTWHVSESDMAHVLSPGETVPLDREDREDREEVNQRAAGPSPDGELDLGVELPQPKVDHVQRITKAYMAADTSGVPVSWHKVRAVVKKALSGKAPPGQVERAVVALAARPVTLTAEMVASELRKPKPYRDEDVWPDEPPKPKVERPF